MSEFNLNDLEKIHKQEEIMNFLIDNGIIKEKKFLKQLAYEKELNELQLEMVRLQAFFTEKNKRILVIFEGRDAAGKGGTIKRMRQSISHKTAKVMALSKPTEREQGQWYFQRYMKHLPNAGEIAFFDRSWYNRAVVEPVFGFCTEKQHDLFIDEVNTVERRLINDGIILIKFFLDISKDEQKKRLDARRQDPLKQWKVGGLDEKAIEKWDDYSHYIKKMLDETATDDLPWIEIKTDDKKTARLQAMKYLLNNVPGFTPSKKLNIDKDVIIVHD